MDDETFNDFDRVFERLDRMVARIDLMSAHIDSVYHRVGRVCDRLARVECRLVQFMIEEGVEPSGIKSTITERSNRDGADSESRAGGAESHLTG